MTEWRCINGICYENLFNHLAHKDLSNEQTLCRIKVFNRDAYNVFWSTWRKHLIVYKTADMDEPKHLRLAQRNEKLFFCCCCLLRLIISLLVWKMYQMRKSNNKQVRRTVTAEELPGSSQRSLYTHSLVAMHIGTSPAVSYRRLAVACSFPGLILTQLHIVKSDKTRGALHGQSIS